MAVFERKRRNYKFVVRRRDLQSLLFLKENVVFAMEFVGSIAVFERKRRNYKFLLHRVKLPEA